MAVAQASAYGLHAGWASAVPSHQHPIKLLCGAITDSAHDGWRDAAADNGLFEVCDGLSYHSYRPPQDEEKLAAVFRNWLASRDGHGDFPLMVTTQRNGSFDLPLYGLSQEGLLAVRRSRRLARRATTGRPRPATNAQPPSRSARQGSTATTTRALGRCGPRVSRV